MIGIKSERTISFEIREITGRSGETEYRQIEGSCIMNAIVVDGFDVSWVDESEERVRFLLCLIFF